MTHPVRLRLSRAKGFNLQEHSRAVNGLPAVNCARPSKFGNPFKIDNESDRERVIERFRRCLVNPPTLMRHKILTISKGMNGRGEGYFLRIRLSLDELRGKNLACFCSLDGACHCDVLLKLANLPICEAVE